MELKREQEKLERELRELKEVLDNCERCNIEKVLSYYTDALGKLFTDEEKENKNPITVKINELLNKGFSVEEVQKYIALYYMKKKIKKDIQEMGLFDNTELVIDFINGKYDKLKLGILTENGYEYITVDSFDDLIVIVKSYEPLYGLFSNNKDDFPKIIVEKV